MKRERERERTDGEMLLALLVLVTTAAAQVPTATPHQQDITLIAIILGVVTLALVVMLACGVCAHRPRRPLPYNPLYEGDKRTEFRPLAGPGRTIVEYVPPPLIPPLGVPVEIWDHTDVRLKIANGSTRHLYFHVCVGGEPIVLLDGADGVVYPYNPGWGVSSGLVPLDLSGLEEGVYRWVRPTSGVSLVTVVYGDGQPEIKKWS